MAAYIPVPDTALVQVFYTLFNQRCENTLYFQRFGGWNASDIANLATSAYTNWSTKALLHLSNQLTFVGSKATDLSSQTGPTATHTASTTGGQALPSAPSNVAFCIKFSTQGRGRSSQGRIYLPGIPSGYITADAIDGNDAFLIEGDINDAVAGIATEFDATHVVVSRYHNHAPRPVGITFPVTDIGYTDVYIDSQRRRLVGRGR